MKQSLLHPSLVLCLALLGTSCSIININIDFLDDPNLESAVLDQDGDLFAHIVPIELNDEIRNYIDSNIESNLAPAAKVGKVRELMFDSQYLNIQYSTDQTFTAAEVFESRSGNCLSVINFYIGVIRYLGLDASFQTVKLALYGIAEVA